MKKKLIFGIIGIIISVGVSATSIDGFGRLSGEKLDDLTVSGNGELRGVSVKNTTQISGSAVINNSNFNAIDISGHAEMNSSNVTGFGVISGSLTANNSKFSGAELRCSGTIISNKNIYTTHIILSGNIISSNDRFNNGVDVSGSIQAESSIFNHMIYLTGEASVWNNSQINTNILDDYSTNSTSNREDEPWIIRIFKKSVTPEIILDNTVVNGNIEFTKIRGLVIMRGNSVVHGNIKNAEIKRQ